ncbi:MAG: flagellar basal-body MS-ring/collar protein FliF [Hyphomonadaceae bacterium]|nr:flagellar basal-body MS-ring/collar protein FliF [Hyphomonadaceae bacterium]
MASLDQWNRLSLGQRVVLALALAGILVAAGTATWWVLRDDYEPLFTKLEPAEVAEITSKLDGEHVAYKLEDGGHSISVAAGEGYRVRAKLLEQGVTPKGGLGFELFDNADMGLTDFAQGVNYQRALQGELVRTLTALEGVESARLHLVLPERKLFGQDQEKPKAAVTLTLRDGARLAPERVDGIRRLIASSVSGLQAESVLVHDQTGAELHGAKTDGESEFSEGRLKVKNEVETYLEQKVQRALDAMVGSGRSLAKFDVSLNLNKTDTVRDEPVTLPGQTTGAILRSKAISSATAKRRPAAAAPQAGGDSANAEAAVDTAPAPSWSPKTTQTETEYQVGRYSEHTKVSPGEIVRISGGVLVPSQLSDQDLAAVRTLVEGVVGIDPQRGDVIVVQRRIVDASKPGVEVDEPLLADGKGASRQANSLLRERYWIVVSALLGLIAVLSAVWVAGRRPAPALTEAEREQQLLRIRGWLEESGA